MSSIFDNKKNKEKCQKFTPQSMVDTMLDLAGYTTNLLGKRVLENSFGTGNILKAIVKRYINFCIDERIPPEIISANLGNDIYGIELDEKLYCNCKAELDDIVQGFKLPAVTWSLYNENALAWKSNIQFDLVIGNPPYITYKEIDEDSKNQIKDTFQTCSIGKFDYCYAFIELGVRYLNKNGKLVQLIPSNIYKNVFAADLRNLLKEHISIIFEYPSQKFFDRALTSTSIFVYDKNHQADYVSYRNITDQIELQIPRDSLKGKWIFSDDLEKDEAAVRFGDVFNASIVIATLLNEAYIVDKSQVANEEIEKSIIRKAASPRSFRYKKEENIIFPYQYVDNKLVRFNPDTFKKSFPGATKHLKKYSKKLGDRKKDKSTYWFEYGRTQALAHLNQEKLLLSTVVTNQVELYDLDKETIPYSGIYITVRDESEFTLNDAKKILKSDQFMEYVKKVGISVSGKSVRITCKDINNFEFKKEGQSGRIKIYN